MSSQGASEAMWGVVVAALSTYPGVIVGAEGLAAPKLQVCHLFAVLRRNPRFTTMLRLRGGSSSGEDKEEANALGKKGKTDEGRSTLM
jgi:hypothetical protein